MEKRCIQCGGNFLISANETFVAGKFDVPLRQLCFECDQKRRLCFRNERALYQRKCDATGETIISVYSPDKPFKVYKSDYWYSDKWDPLEYGREFDFNRPFSPQYKELQLAVPRLALHNIKSENSDYCNSTYGNKNCYLIFGGDLNQDSLFGTLCMQNRDVADCDLSNHNELCYMMSDTVNSYDCQFAFDCKNCTNCYFVSDCSGCHECILGTNLVNKSYHIHNQPYSKEDYLVKKNELLRPLYSQQQKLWQEFLDLRTKRVVKYIHTIGCQDCGGDYLKNSKNCRHCFDVAESEDLENIVFAMLCKDCVNCTMLGDKSELCYELASTFGAYNSRFSFFTIDSANIEYSEMSIGSQDLFGCIGLRKKQYCILNKQYAKEEYLALREKIIRHMKKVSYSPTTPLPPSPAGLRRAGLSPLSTGGTLLRQGFAGQAIPDLSRVPFGSTSEWGQFFPAHISCFGYNETTAGLYYPMKKEAAVKEGFNWHDPIETSQRDVSTKDQIPDDLQMVTDDILKEVFICSTCQKRFRLVPQELKFYRKINVPVPRECPDCRHNRRMNLRNPRKLWPRTCQKCGVEVETTYEELRREVVCCERCYLESVY